MALKDWEQESNSSTHIIKYKSKNSSQFITIYKNIGKTWTVYLSWDKSHHAFKTEPKAFTFARRYMLHNT